MDYTLNPEAAKQADNLFSRIEEKGKYLGMLTRAEPITSKKGSKGVDFSFKSETGATADYLTIWTHNGDGKQFMPTNDLNAPARANIAAGGGQNTNVYAGGVFDLDADEVASLTALSAPGVEAVDSDVFGH